MLKNNKKIILYHFIFGSLFILLLIAPQIPIGNLTGFKRNTLSLGFIPLLLWLIFSPREVIKSLRNIYSKEGLIIITITMGVIRTLVLLEIVSTLYAIQFWFYAFFSFLFFSSYFKIVIKKKQFSVLIKILILIGVIYASGCIISTFIGPIYPYQAGATRAYWGGGWVQKGTGFAEGQNSAGVILSTLLWLAIFLFSHHKITKKWIISIIIIGLGLFSTLSRGAIFSFILGLLIFLILLLIRTLKTSYIKRFLFRKLLIIFIINIIIFFSLATISTLLFPSYSTGILRGFGINNSQQVVYDATQRFLRWSEGIKFWEKQRTINQLIGGGFRSSSYQDKSGLWHTPHNFYISVLGDFGIIGLLMFVVIVLVSIIIEKGLKLLTQKRNIAINSFVFTSLISISINNFLGPYIYSPVILTLFILVLSISHVGESISNEN